MILRIGDDGPLVGQVQQDLIEAGGAIEATELTELRFGPSTYDAIRDFQVRHTGPTGHALAEDGIVGPETFWALEHAGNTGNRWTAPGWRCAPSDARPNVRPVIFVAVGEIGNREDPDGSNRGPNIDKYGGDGQPWCAFFLSWCYIHSEPPSPFGLIASAWKMKEWGETVGRILPAQEPLLAGDIGVIMRANGHGHVVMVGQRFPDGKIATIEGNAGNAVRGLIRDPATFSCVVRPIPL